MTDLTIIYRGEITACNFRCSYCPFLTLFDTAVFNTTANNNPILAREEKGLETLADFIKNAGSLPAITLLFAPRGEVLNLECYRRYITLLSRLPGVKQIVIQTNFTFPLSWLTECRQEKIALWITFHPEQQQMGPFLEKITRLSDFPVPFSVGMVGLKEYKKTARALRSALPNSHYLWINAYKRNKNYYSPEDITFFTSIDPLFPLNLTDYKSKGKACYAGQNSICLNSRGQVKACFFQEKVLGVLGETELQQLLNPAVCPNEQCTCYLGYMNLKELEMEKRYKHIQARIPGLPLRKDLLNR